MNTLPELTQEYHEERFTIQDDSGAEWAIKKIIEKQQENEMWAEHYANQLKATREKNQSEIDYFTTLLYEYFLSVPRKTTRTGIEKYKLPSGELVSNPPKIDYQRDDAVLLAWCKLNAPDMVRVKEEPAWSDIKKTIADSGVLPDGVTPIEKPAAFSIKF